MIRVAAWIGRRAPVVLALGCLAALALPALSTFTRPILPVMVSLVLGISIARVARSGPAAPAGRPAPRAFVALATITAMPVGAAIYVAIVLILGASRDVAAFAAVLGMSPPIASAAALCQIVGLNARRALEVTLVAAAATPVLGPVALTVLAPSLPAVQTFDLAVRLATIIVGGFIIALAIAAANRRVALFQNDDAFNGLAAVTMVLFVFPLLDGVGSKLVVDPAAAAVAGVVVVAMNLGVNAAVALLALRMVGRIEAATLGLLCGNRNAAVYLAALPPDPGLAFLIALYQFPVYLTPLILGRILRRPPGP